MTVQIAYIAGWMRSGTTLLCGAIGDFEDSIAVGELSGIWLAAAKDHTCSCGAPLSDCALWAPVLRDFSDANPHLSYVDLADLSRAVLRTRRVDRLLRLKANKPSAWPEDIRRYTEAMSTLYSLISKHSGRSRIVDSSKLPPSFLIQRLVPSVETRVLHIIRDPRAVANSELRTFVRNGPNPELIPPGKRPLRSALLWSGANIAVAALASVSGPVMRVRYEQFVGDPEWTLDAIAEFLTTRRGNESLSPGHIAVGNPSRMLTSKRKIKHDISWQTELPKRSKLLVAAATAPARLVLRVILRAR